MFARMMTVQMRPGSRGVAEQLAERWHQAVATLPEFVSASFFLDDDAGVYGYYSVWESRDAAELVLDEVGEQLPDALAEHALQAPTVQIFAVYVPPA